MDRTRRSRAEKPCRLKAETSTNLTYGIMLGPSFADLSWPSTHTRATFGQLPRPGVLRKTDAEPPNAIKARTVYWTS